jgi:hypothetical protein
MYKTYSLAYIGFVLLRGFILYVILNTLVFIYIMQNELIHVRDKKI